MYFRHKKMIQTTTFLLVICLANTFVFARIPRENVPPNGAVSKPEDPVIEGVLTAFDASSVKVNGNPAQDGMTILSGSQISTGKSSGATINLPKLGKIELPPEASIKLAFVADHIELQVSNGQARLTTYKGVTGTLTAADGKVYATDPSLDISSVMTIEKVNVTAPITTPKATAGGRGLFGTWGSMASGALSGTVVAWTGLGNTSNASKSSISRVRP